MEHGEKRKDLNEQYLRSVYSEDVQLPLRAIWWRIKPSRFQKQCKPKQPQTAYELRPHPNLAFSEI